MAPIQAKPAQGPQRPRQPPKLGLLAAAVARLEALRECPIAMPGCSDGHTALLGGLGSAGDAAHLRLSKPPLGIRPRGAAVHPFTGGLIDRIAGAGGNYIPNMGAVGTSRSHAGPVSPAPRRGAGWYRT